MYRYVYAFVVRENIIFFLIILDLQAVINVTFSNIYGFRFYKVLKSMCPLAYVL